jgi:integrase
MSDSEYRLGRLGGECCLVYYDSTGTRRRYRLGTRDPRQAALLAPALFAELTRPKGTKVRDLWDAFTHDKAGRAITETMVHTWKALKDRFGDMAGDAITDADCRAHTKKRRAAGIKDGTIHTELGHLRMVLNFAVKKRLLSNASHIERPAAPKRREDVHLTRPQIRALFDGATMPHVRLAAILLYTTAARSSALCGLTWGRCDFDRERIDLRDPTINRPHKGRAIVPMLRTSKVALLEARRGALTNHVIEWGGNPVKSLKRGLKTAARNAQIEKTVSAHILRHSAAVHMAENGVPMDEIAQFLGHEDVEVTRRTYARFSPDFLKKAARALEFDDLGSLNQRALPKSGSKPLNFMVGATGIEPVTPTMSR